MKGRALAGLGVQSVQPSANLGKELSNPTCLVVSNEGEYVNHGGGNLDSVSGRVVWRWRNANVGA